MLSKLFRKKNRSYVSEADQFLAELEAKIGEKSQSRKKEEEKYARIFEMRDRVTR